MSILLLGDRPLRGWPVAVRKDDSGGNGVSVAVALDAAATAVAVGGVEGRLPLAEWASKSEDDQEAPWSTPPPPLVMLPLPLLPLSPHASRSPAAVDPADRAAARAADPRSMVLLLLLLATLEGAEGGRPRGRLAEV